MNDSRNEHDMKMMWMMMLFCLLPIILISFFSGALAGRGWVSLVIGMLIFAVVQAFMMRGMHKPSRDADTRSDDTQSNMHGLTTTQGAENNKNSTTAKRDCCGK